MYKYINNTWYTCTYIHTQTINEQQNNNFAFDINDAMISRKVCKISFSN